MNIGGTSMASPQVAGLAALKAQSLPTRNPDRIRGDIINDAKNVVYNTGSSTDYDNLNQSLLGSEPNIMFSKYAVYNPMSYSGPITIRNVGPRLR
jgi:subtilisin family serine protease